MRAFAKQYGAALALSLLSAGAVAGTFTQSPDPASVAQGGSVTIDFLFAGDGVTEDTQLDLNYNTSVFTTVTPTVLVAGSVCAVFPGPGFIRIVPPSGAGTPLPNAATAYCRFSFTAAPGAAPGNYDFGERLIECGPNSMVPCVRSGPFRITVTGGGGGGTAPTVTYNPNFGSTINFPGGPAGPATASIAVTSSGGTAPGSVTVDNCSATAGFTITNAPINLTGTAGGAQINGNINLQCTRGGAVQNGTLSCRETPNPAVAGSPFTRTWNLTCPAAVADVPPTLIYQPAPGNVTISGTVGNTVAQTLDVSCDGVAGGNGACTGSGNGTARLQNLTVTGFSPSSLSCAFVTEAGAAAASPLNFVAGNADPGDIRCTCIIPSVNQSYIVSVTEVPNAANPGTTVQRQWNVTCGAGQVCGTISANPASGSVTLNNGGAATTVTTVTVAGSGASISRTVSCALSGVSGATFNVTTSPSPLTIVGNGTGTVSATCSNSNAAAGTATLTCTSTSSDPQCPTLNATYTLTCPGVTQSVTSVPVPALGQQGRILLAALMLALGLVVVGFRLRG
jgi:hypothetical protein